MAGLSGETNVVQTAIKHPMYLKFLIESAKKYIDTPSGKIPTNAEVMIIATGKFCTEVLKEVGVYEINKEWYVNKNGPVQEYDDIISFGGDGIPSGNEDSVFAQVDAEEDNE